MASLHDRKTYTPGRFAYLMENAFAGDLWAFLTNDSHLQQMLASVAKEKPAIEPLLPEIELRFAEPLASPLYPPEDVAVFINNMIRQIMEQCGYEHSACGICRGRFFTMSGLYRLRSAVE